MSLEINATDWFIQANTPFHDGNYTSGARPVASNVIPMTLSLTTAGRLGFFIDYSERTAVGTHTFYVARTHGSVGVVSVDYATSGDTHTASSGTMTWQDDDMGIKSFTVDVTAANLTNHQTTLGLGEHRIVARLSNPTNSGVLHFGTEETKAYGVIDNNVLASNANAVFYDSAAASTGNGTQATPYDSVYTAIAAIGTKRYLYGKGTTVVDGTFSASFDGFAATKYIPVPATRTGESTRVFVRNWSGNTWTISDNGVDTNVGGFLAFNTNESFCTYKGIDFLNLDNSTSSDGFGVYYRYGSPKSINIEVCTANNINGRTGGNHGGYMLWGVDGGKVWRCVADNIQNGGDNTNGNTGMFYTYLGLNISVQRCEATNCANLIHHKRIATAFDVSTSVRFCKDATEYGVHYGASGSSGVPHAYTIVQCNFLLPVVGANTGITHSAGDQGLNGSNNGGKHWWCNNVFYERGSGEQAAIHVRQAYSAAIFNNIMLDCRRVWADYRDSSATGADIEYADYNCEFGTTLPDYRYEWKAVDYATATLLNAANPAYAGNDINQAPLFTDADNGDFTLQPTSPALTNGVGGTQQGAYLGNFYTVGAAN